MIARLAWIIAGYLASCVTAALVIAAEMLADGAPASGEALFAVMVIGSGLAAVYACVPAAVTIAVGEASGLRSAAYYAAAGAAAAVFAWWIFSLRQGDPGLDPLRGVKLLGVPGLAAGLVYWRIAGRKAGRHP